MDDDCNGIIDDEPAATTQSCGEAACQHGACVCTNPATTLCGGVCADLSSSSQHCGACEHACNVQLGPTCKGGTCRCGPNPLCVGQPGAQGTWCVDNAVCRSEWSLANAKVSGIAVTDDALYYAVTNDYDSQHGLWRIGKAGGTAIVQNVPVTSLLAADGKRLVFGAGSLVGSCPPSGCDGYVTLTNAAVDVQVVAAAAGTAYWVESNGDVWSCAETGCVAPSQVAAAVGGGAPAPFLSADSSGVYVAFRDGRLFAIPPGGTAEPVATGLGTVTSLALDQDRIYVAASSGIVTCPKSTAPCVPTLFRAGSGAEESVVADGSRVYILDGQLHACLRSGCPATIPLADTFDVPLLAPGLTLTFDADSLYIGGVRFPGGVVRYTK